MEVLQYTGWLPTQFPYLTVRYSHRRPPALCWQGSVHLAGRLRVQLGLLAAVAVGYLDLGLGMKLGAGAAVQPVLHSCHSYLHSQGIIIRVQKRTRKELTLPMCLPMCLMETQLAPPCAPAAIGEALPAATSDHKLAPVVLTHGISQLSSLLLPPVSHAIRFPYRPWLHSWEGKSSMLDTQARTVSPFPGTRCL